MLAILFFIFTATAFALPCGEYEIYIREQWIDTYTKPNGSKVSAHTRNAHCREIVRSNYFQDSTNQTFKNLQPKIKKWNAKEKKLIQENLALLPPWLSKYYLAEILRGDIGGHINNPAGSLVSTRTLLIFDQFFKEKDKRAVIIHEMAHIALPSIDPELKYEFARASGWRLEESNKLIPPSKLLMDDSKDSINEDLTNYIESYYTDANKLMAFNSLAFLVVKQIVDSKENEQ